MVAYHSSLAHWFAAAYCKCSL